MKAEQWKPIVGFEGWYEISDKGRCRSVDRKRYIIRENPTDYIPYVYVIHYKSRILKPQWTSSQHGSRFLSVMLCDENGHKTYKKLHRLVAEHFVKNPDPATKKRVAFVDGDRTHCEASNLVWSRNGEVKNGRRKNL